MAPYFYIFGIQFSSYVTMISLAFLVSGIIFYFLVKKKVSKTDFILLCLFVIIGALIGAKLMANIVAIPLAIKYNWTFFETFIKSGFVFYGGAIGAFIMGLFYIKMFGLNPKMLINSAIICLPLGQAIGRIGCFLAGCCYGVETNSIFGVIFTNSLDSTIPLTHVHPTQLYECFACLVIFITLIFIYKKYKSSYFVFFMYTLLYGVARFVIEFFRGDYNRGVLFLSTSQYISILLVLFGAVLCFTKLKDAKLFTQTKPIIKTFTQITDFKSNNNSKQKDLKNDNNKENQDYNPNN